MRKLPVYLLLDTSASMSGEPIEAVKNSVQVLASTLRQDPYALEPAQLGVITFDSSAKQLIPLTELVSFQLSQLSAEQKRQVGYFVFHNGNWYLVNERLRDLMDVTMGTPCPPGNPMQLQEGQQILRTREEGECLAFVQMVDS